jgi:hypothetical protein
MLRLFNPLREWGGRLVLCGVRGTFGDVLAVTRLDKIVAAQTQPVPGGRLLLPEHSWLTWNDGTVLQLTRAIRKEHAFDRMPVLADALEEAGCIEADILGHCRSGEKHLPDCWVLGLLAVDA